MDHSIIPPEAQEPKRTKDYTHFSHSINIVFIILINFFLCVQHGIVIILSGA